MTGNLHSKFRFAMLGFSITALFVAYQLVTDPFSDAPRDSAMMIFFTVLCPTSLLAIPIIDAEVGTSAFYFVWTIVGFLNAALYGTIAALISRRKKSTDSTDKLPS
jgi:asparagine N-glycosylation enzyme membrane subunit Stt3